jgi:hypothetical protein
MKMMGNLQFLIVITVLFPILILNRMAKFSKILFFILVFSACGWLFYLVDNGLGIGWPKNAVNNWEQYGLFALHGQLIPNPGGFGALTHPHVYAGMSPISCYPFYFSTVLFNWTGLGDLAFYVLLALAVFWGIYELLGRNLFAVIVAVAAILCPGYIRWQKILDPNVLAVLPAIPYAVLILKILRKQNASPLMLVLMFILTIGFMSLNWSTAWVCGPLIALFFGMPGVNRRSLLLLIGVIVISGMLIVLASVISKTGMHNGNTSHSQVIAQLAGHLWGSSGYGQGLTTGRAFLLLAFTNTVALFPLWLALAYAAFRCIWAGGRVRWLLTFAPLGLTIADVVIMRDYFGHHPWMASPVLIVGAVFSLALLRMEMPPGVTDKIPLAVVTAAALFCFVYGLAVLVFFRANMVNQLSMIALVRENTTRSDDIVVVKSADPASVAWANRFDELLDRHVVMADDFNGLAAEKSRYFILSSVPINGPFAIAAKKTVDDHQWANKVANWFNHSVAHRLPGDRMELPDTYYLYRPNQ